MDPVQRTYGGTAEGVAGTVLRVLMGHVGRAAAIGRWQLAHEVTVRCGLPGGPDGEGNPEDAAAHPYDRVIRKAIEELRRSDDTGALICSSSSGLGYFLAADAQELEASLNEDHHRALSLLQRISAQKDRGLVALQMKPMEQGKLPL